MLYYGMHGVRAGRGLGCCASLEASNKSPLRGVPPHLLPLWGASTLHQKGPRLNAPYITCIVQGFDEQGVARAPVHVIAGNGGAGLAYNIQDPPPDWLQVGSDRVRAAWCGGMAQPCLRVGRQPPSGW